MVFFCQSAISISCIPHSISWQEQSTGTTFHVRDRSCVSFFLFFIFVYMTHQEAEVTACPITIPDWLNSLPLLYWASSRTKTNLDESSAAAGVKEKRANCTSIRMKNIRQTKPWLGLNTDCFQFFLSWCKFFQSSMTLSQELFLTWGLKLAVMLHFIHMLPDSGLVSM